MKKVILLLSFTLCCIVSIAQIPSDKALMIGADKQTIYKITNSKMCHIDTTRCRNAQYQVESQLIMHQGDSWYLFDALSFERKYFPIGTKLYGEETVVMFFPKQEKILFLYIQKI